MSRDIWFIIHVVVIKVGYPSIEKWRTERRRKRSSKLRHLRTKPEKSSFRPWLQPPLSEEIVFHTNTKISWLLQPKKLPNLTKKSAMKTLKNQALENVQYFDKVSQNRCDDPNSEVNMTNWLQNIIDDKFTVCKNA